MNLQEIIQEKKKYALRHHEVNPVYLDGYLLALKEMEELQSKVTEGLKSCKTLLERRRK